MRNYFKNFTPLLLIMLKLCISVSGNVTTQDLGNVTTQDLGNVTIKDLGNFTLKDLRNFTIKDLGLVCAIRKNTKLTAIPKECTAVAVYSVDIDELGGINNMRGELPLLVIIGHIEWKNIGDIFKHDIVDLLKPFQNVGFDFMVFDNTYKNIKLEFFGGSSAVTKFSEKIASFLQQIKTAIPIKQFGLVLGHDVPDMKDRIDLSVIKDHSDFFLLESTGYRDCGMHTHQADMEVLATRDDVFSSLTDLKNLNIPMDKVIYTIELKIESRKQVLSEDMDYTYLCSNELSDDRKYCFNTIQNLFEKARLRISEGTAGIFINGVDFDDYNGTCGCKTPTDPDACFRGLKTIAGASLENTNEVSFYECSEGTYPVIKN